MKNVFDETTPLSGDGPSFGQGRRHYEERNAYEKRRSSMEAVKADDEEQWWSRNAGVLCFAAGFVLLSGELQQLRGHSAIDSSLH